MSEFFQQVVAGLGSGAIYGALALALVLIHRATGVINFAQGEMAMFTTYIAWTLIENHGWSYWPAFVVTLAFAFLLGLGVQRVVIAPVSNAPILTIVIMTIGLVLTFNGLASLIWSAEIRAFPSPFPNETWQIGGVSISQQDVGTFAVVLALVALLWAFFQFTKVGLALRASALNPDASRLVGVRVGWMLAIGWGLAAMLGAVAGMLAAPTVLLDPNMMQAILIYAFAAAVLGGIDSPLGAVAGRPAPRGRAEPDRHLQRLRRRRPEAARRAADHPRRAARPPGRALRQAGHEARVKRRELIWVLGFVVAAAAVFLLPRFVSDFRAQQFAYVGIYFIALLGLNLLTGITGQISLGHGAFMLIGGYTTAILISDQGLKLGSHTFSSDMTDIWTIPIAGLVAGLAGFLFGFPALRLTGLYLALATFAIAVAAPAVVRKFDEFTGGGGGINMFGLPGLTGVDRSRSRFRSSTRRSSFNEWLYYLSWTIALVMLAVAWLLLRGRFGRSLRAVRDSELAAASSGVNLARYKTLAFGISAFYAGVAGSLLAIATTFVNPDTFPITLSIFLLVGVVVGGLGSLWPLVFGAIFIHFMQIEWAQRVESVIPDWLPLLGDLDTDAPGAPAVAFGVILILIMLLAPGGAAGLLYRLKVAATRGYHRVR